jgi:hypothetical protein
MASLEAKENLGPKPSFLWESSWSCLLERPVNPRQLVPGASYTVNPHMGAADFLSLKTILSHH